ncbi:MAG TPA: amidohydrolase family protein [Acidimicrobiales bacterium]|nr:amidohydrolase family protein [Acidimicrobiales bacterium]
MPDTTQVLDSPTAAQQLDRYLIISADCHAGAEMYAYRDYLERRYHDDFDSWAASYVNPFGDLNGPDADRNYNSDRRIAELEADGTVAEVLYPNTIPPFFPSSSLFAPPPTPADFEHRWAGLRAHNRWLAEFCGEEPERRAGIAQILMNDVDAAVVEIRWIKEAGLRGGIMVPGVPPDSDLPPLFSEAYEPIWTVCEELGVPVNHHGGNASPMGLSVGGVSGAVFLIEQGWYSHRALWQLIFSGVFERHPDLKFVMTEQGGASWLPGLLDFLDFYYERFGSASETVEARFGGPAVANLSLTPREYWHRNCYMGASFMRRVEAPLRYQIGVDRIMWGVDYPHSEMTYPYSRESLRWTFADVAADEMRQMLGGTAAEVYGFDLDVLAPIAARVGPTVEEITVPLDQPPADSISLGFTQENFNRPW